MRFRSGRTDGTGPEAGMDLASEWIGIMGELKRRRQALTGRGLR